MYLLYTYYKNGRWERVPHFHMLTSLSLLGYLNITTILCFLSKSKWLFDGNTDRVLIRSIILVIIIAIVLNFIGSKKALEALMYSNEAIRTGNWVLMLYTVVSFSVMIWSFSIEANRNRDADKPTKITPIKDVGFEKRFRSALGTTGGTSYYNHTQARQ